MYVVVVWLMATLYQAAPTLPLIQICENKMFEKLIPAFPFICKTYSYSDYCEKTRQQLRRRKIQNIQRRKEP